MTTTISGTSGVTPPAGLIGPTYQVFTSGTAATYTYTVGAGGTAGSTGGAAGAAGRIIVEEYY